MSIYPEDFTRLVLDDLAQNQMSRKPVKAGILERIFVNKLPPKKIHANPQDEFSMKNIGPNFGIVSKYQRTIAYNEENRLPIFEEPLIVEKLFPKDYILLNGHHRWFAAVRSNVSKIRVQIVNLVHEEDLNEMFAQSTNNLCVSMDLDEVLLAGSNGLSIEPINPGLKSTRIKDRLRKGAPSLISELQKRGFDVWVYTADYRSLEDIEAIFRMYGVKLNGIMNATSRKNSKEESFLQQSRQMFREKYDQILHIDQESVVCTHARTHTFDDYSLSLSHPDQWADSVIKVIDSLKF